MAPPLPGVIDAVDGFELFGPGKCDTQLPINEIVEEYTFGQFVRLRGDGRPVTAMLPNASQRNFLSAVGAAPLERAVTIHALLAGKPEPLPPLQSTVEVRRVEIDDLDQFLAHRSIDTEKGKVRVSLDADKVGRLLAGVPVEALAQGNRQHIRVLLVPAEARSCAATEPAVRRYAVPDLAAFLLKPEVPGVGGAPYPVVLDATAVKQLRMDGVARVGAGQSQVMLTIESGRANSSFAASANVNVHINGNGVPVHFGAADALAGMDGPTDAARVPYFPGIPGGEAWPNATPAAPPQSQDAFTLGLYLPWTQSWRLKGYSRGALLHSLTLAPQEETTIELFSWDRRKRSLDQSSSFDSEQSIENSETTKDVIDVVRELASSNEFKIEGHARVNVKYAAVEAEVGIKGNYTSKLNETAKRSTNHLVDSTQKASARVRVNRQTKISESSETGSEERVTRKVRNPNMCHTLTLDYFEVLAHYIVTTAFAKDEAQVCFFVPFPIWLRAYQFAEEDLRVHERDLRGALINPELSGGFEAARTLWARNWAMRHVCDAPTCQHGETTESGGTDTSNRTSRALLEEATKRVAAICWILYLASPRTLARTIIADHRIPSSAEALEAQNWGFLKLLERNYGSLRAALVKLGMAGQTFSLPGGITYQVAPPLPMDEQIEMLEQMLDATPPATLQIIDTGRPVDELKPLLMYETTSVVQQYVPEFDLNGYNQSRIAAMMSVGSAYQSMNCFDPDDGGLVAALVNFQKQLTAYKRAQDLSADGDDALNLRAAQHQAMLDADADQVRSAFPLSDTAAAAERVQALIKHLNQHLSHYRFALLQALPIGDQMQELAMLGIPTDLVEPRILGMVSGGLSGVDLLAVPINTALEPQWKAVRDTFIDGNTELVKLSAKRETRMPTPGASVEARLGACDACEEFIMESRAIELDQRRAQVRAQKAAARITELEGDRAEARVKEGDLDDPTPEPGGLHVTIDKPS